MYSKQLHIPPFSEVGYKIFHPGAAAGVSLLTIRVTFRVGQDKLMHERLYP